MPFVITSYLPWFFEFVKTILQTIFDKTNSCRDFQSLTALFNTSAIMAVYSLENSLGLWRRGLRRMSAFWVISVLMLSSLSHIDLYPHSNAWVVSACADHRVSDSRFTTFRFRSFNTAKSFCHICLLTLRSKLKTFWTKSKYAVAPVQQFTAASPTKFKDWALNGTKRGWGFKYFMHCRLHSILLYIPTILAALSYVNISKILGPSRISAQVPQVPRC